MSQCFICMYIQNCVFQANTPTCLSSHIINCLWAAAEQVLRWNLHVHHWHHLDENVSMHNMHLSLSSQEELKINDAPTSGSSSVLERDHHKQRTNHDVLNVFWSVQAENLAA